MLDTCCDFSCEGVQEYWCFRLSPVWNAAVCPEFQAPSWTLVVITVKICDCNFVPPVNVWILRYQEDFVFACLSCTRHDTFTCTTAPDAKSAKHSKNKTCSARGQFNPRADELTTRQKHSHRAQRHGRLCTRQKHVQTLRTLRNCARSDSDITSSNRLPMCVPYPIIAPPRLPHKIALRATVRVRRHLRPVSAFYPRSSRSCHSSTNHALCLLQSVLRADLARKPNFSLLVRRCACPALLGRKSTARLWTERRCRSGCTGTAEMGET